LHIYADVPSSCDYFTDLLMCQSDSEKYARHFQLLREMPTKFSDFTKFPSETVIT